MNPKGFAETQNDDRSDVVRDELKKENIYKLSPELRTPAINNKCKIVF